VDETKINDHVGDEHWSEWIIELYWNVLSSNWRRIYWNWRWRS
jgi:hypothetical protein